MLPKHRQQNRIKRDSHFRNHFWPVSAPPGWQTWPKLGPSWGHASFSYALLRLCHLYSPICCVNAIQKRQLQFHTIASSCSSVTSGQAEQRLSCQWVGRERQQSRKSIWIWSVTGANIRAKTRATFGPNQNDKMSVELVRFPSPSSSPPRQPATRPSSIRGGYHFRVCGVSQNSSRRECQPTCAENAALPQLIESILIT